MLSKSNSAMIINNNSPESYHIINNAKHYYNTIFGLIDLNVLGYLFLSIIIYLAIIVIYVNKPFKTYQTTKEQQYDLIMFIIVILYTILIMVNIVLCIIIFIASYKQSIYLNENIYLNDFNYSKNINETYWFKWLFLILILISAILTIYISLHKYEYDINKISNMKIMLYILIILLFIYIIWNTIYSSILINAINHVKNMNKDAYFKQEAYKINQNGNNDYPVYIYVNGKDFELIKS